MALTATFTADFSSFQAAVLKAEATLKSFEGDASKVETSLSRMENAFSGVKLVQQATIAIKAVDDLGGVATLTEQELRRFASTTNEAAEKVDRLASSGVAITPEMAKIADASKAANEELKKVSSTGGLFGQLDDALGKVGLSLSTIGLAAAGAKLFGLATEAVTLAGHLKDLSAATGISVGDLQRLEYAGAKVGVSLDAVALGVQRMQRNLVEASPAATNAIRSLGLSVDDLLKLNPGEMFETLSEAIAKVPDPAQRTAIAIEVLGRGGVELLPLLVDNVKELEGSFQGMSKTSVEGLDTLGDALSSLWIRAKAQVGDLIAGFTSLKGAMNLQTPGLEAGAEKALSDIEAALKRATAAAPDLTKGLLPAKHALDDLIDDLDRRQKVNDETTKKSIAGYDQELDAIQKLKEALTGLNLAKQVTEISTAIADLGGVSKLSVAATQDLGKQLQDLRDKGAVLEPRLAALADKYLATSDAQREWTDTLDANKVAQKSSQEQMDRFFQSLDDDQKHLQELSKELDKMQVPLRAMLSTLPQYKLHLDSATVAAMAATAAHTQLSPALLADVNALIQETGSLDKAIAKLKEYNSITEQQEAAIRAHYAAVKTLGQSLDELSRAFSTLSQIGGGSFSGVVKAIGEGIGSINLIQKGFTELTSAEQAWNAEGGHTVSTFVQIASAAASSASGFVALAQVAIQAYQVLTKSSRDAAASYQSFVGQFTTSDAFGVLRDGASVLREKLFALGATGEALWNKLYGAQRSGDAARVLGAINEITAALRDQLAAQDAVAKAAQDAADAAAQAARDQQQDMADLQEAMQKYGFTVADMGDAFKRQNLDQQAGKLLNSFRLLVGAGADVGKVIKAMGGDLNKFVQDAVAMGQDLPIELQPILQRMADMGELFDANGNKIDNLQAAGITFGHTLSQQFDRVVDALNKILEALGWMPKKIFDASEQAVDYGRKWDSVAGSVDGARRSVEDFGRAIDALPSVPGFDTSGPVYVPPENPGPKVFAMGGIVPSVSSSFWAPQGPDKVPALLSPGERVLSVSEASRSGADATTPVIVNISAWDGESVKTWLASGGDVLLARSLTQYAKDRRLTRA